MSESHPNQLSGSQSDLLQRERDALIKEIEILEKELYLFKILFKNKIILKSILKRVGINILPSYKRSNG